MSDPFEDYLASEDDAADAAGGAATATAAPPPSASADPFAAFEEKTTQAGSQTSVTYHLPDVGETISAPSNVPAEAVNDFAQREVYDKRGTRQLGFGAAAATASFDFFRGASASFATIPSTIGNLVRQHAAEINSGLTVEQYVKMWSAPVKFLTDEDVGLAAKALSLTKGNPVTESFLLGSMLERAFSDRTGAAKALDDVGKAIVASNKAWIAEHPIAQPAAGLAGSLGYGAGSVAQAIGLSVLVKSPEVVPVLFGLQTEAATYERQREGGAPAGRAAETAQAAGVLTAGMYLPGAGTALAETILGRSATAAGVEAALNVARKTPLVQRLAFDAGKNALLTAGNALGVDLINDAGLNKQGDLEEYLGRTAQAALVGGLLSVPLTGFGAYLEHVGAHEPLLAAGLTREQAADVAAKVAAAQHEAALPAAADALHNAVDAQALVAEDAARNQRFETAEDEAKLRELPVRTSIPAFKNTQEALAFGEANAGNADVAADLRAQMAALDPRIDAAEKAKDYQQGADLAVERQLLREALEAVGAEAPPNVAAAGQVEEGEGALLGERAANRLYVVNTPFDLYVGADDAETARDLRAQFVGIKNEQIVRGNQLADEIKRDVPDPVQRGGMFWLKAANGDPALLAEALAEEAFKPYRAEIEAALHATDEMRAALAKVDRYYAEAGDVAREVGTLRALRENYQNRIYKPEPPADFVKTETKSGIKQTTRHAKARVYDTEFDAVRGGKEFATTDVADALALHNEELARVNASRKMAEAMADGGLAAWRRPDNVPDGWAQVGTIQKAAPIRDADGQAVLGDDGNQLVSRSVLAAPEGIARGLAAVADPNFVSRIDALRGVQKYQGLVKTVDLSFSFFHHLTMAAQTIYQGGIRTLVRVGTMEAALATPEFAALERDFVAHQGMTSKVEANQDVLRNLVENTPEMFREVAKRPEVKAVLDAADRSREFLFDKLQRWMKVTDYGAKMANWVADHAEASNEEVAAAKAGFAKEINAAYGGLNWEAMGMTRSNLALARLALLAPDWTISNYELLRYAVGLDLGEGKPEATAAASARAHIATALVGGMAATEALSYVLTGHFTDKNKRGHQLEVEVAPNVYVSLLRGGIGDITRFGSMVAESGLAGVGRFAQGKLAPFPRTAVGLLTNTQYQGMAITHKAAGPIGGTYDVLKYLLSSAAPVPFGASSLIRYASDREATLAGALMVGTGVARYSKSKR